MVERDLCHLHCVHNKKQAHLRWWAVASGRLPPYFVSHLTPLPQERQPIAICHKPGSWACHRGFLVATLCHGRLVSGVLWPVHPCACGLLSPHLNPRPSLMSAAMHSAGSEGCACYWGFQVEREALSPGFFTKILHCQVLFRVDCKGYSWERFKKRDIKLWQVQVSQRWKPVDMSTSWQAISLVWSLMSHSFFWLPVSWRKYWPSHFSFLYLMSCSLSDRLLSISIKGPLAKYLYRLFSVSLVPSGRWPSHGFGVPVSLLIPVWKEFRWAGERHLKFSDPM